MKKKKKVLMKVLMNNHDGEGVGVNNAEDRHRIYHLVPRC